MNRLKTQILFIALFLAFIAGRGLPLFAAPSEPDMVTAEKYFLEGKYENTVHESQRLIDERARQRYEVYYLKGLSELKLNRFQDARKSFEVIVNKYGKSKRAFDAYLGIGDSYVLEGNSVAAIGIYNEILKKYPNDKNIAIVKERLVQCNTKQCSPDQIAGSNNDLKMKEIPRSESKGYASVQVGSFKNRRNADSLSKKLSARGYKSYVELPVASNDRHYRVKVGRFDSKDEAESLAAKLNREGYRTKICDETTRRP